MSLLLVFIEGQLYLVGIVAIFVAELACLLWGLWSRRPIVGLIAVFVILPLLRTTVSAIRACFVRIHAPEGLPLGRSEGSALYDLVEEIRRAIDAPPIDGITITGGFDASAVVGAPAWCLRRRRMLVLGFPVLATLSLSELRAVIAHELAHFSSASLPTIRGRTTPIRPFASVSPDSTSRYGYLRRSQARLGANCSVRSSRDWPAGSTTNGRRDTVIPGASIARSISGEPPRSIAWRP